MASVWAEEERILVLDLYLRCGTLDKSDQRVEELCRALDAMTIHPIHSDSSLMRSPDAVEAKLKNFAWLDPNQSGGLRNVARGDIEVWDRYACDEDALDEIVAAITKEDGLLTALLDETPPTRLSRIGVYSQYVEQLQYVDLSQDNLASRRQQALILAYAEHLKQLEHTLSRGEYGLENTASALASDLVDETDLVLYVAKSDMRRASVRMAIGQLLDYRQFEEKSMKLALLLPRKPVQDTIDLVLSVPASVVWRTTDGFASIWP